MSTKPIVSIVEPIPNYLLHLLASARVCFDSTYADKYQRFVDSEDIKFLQANRAALTWGAGQGGELCEFVVTLPIIFGLDDKPALDEYFELLIEALSSQSAEAFFTKYRDTIDYLERTWFPLKPEALLACAHLAGPLNRYHQVIENNYVAYLNEVWPVERVQMNAVADELNVYFSTHDIIADWEKLTGRKLVAEQYTIVLSSAIENGPNANSVGYAKNIFCSKRSLDWTRDFISHEIGIHILMSEFRNLADSGKYDWMQLYAANECLAQFLNGIVLNKSPLAYDLKQFGAHEKLKAYEGSFRAGTRLDYAELLSQAINLKGK